MTALLQRFEDITKKDILTAGGQRSQPRRNGTRRDTGTGGSSAYHRGLQAVCEGK